MSEEKKSYVELMREMRQAAQAVHAYRPPCAHIGCTEPTIAKIDINKIPVFVCKTHYDAHYTVEARKYSESLGLFTVEQKRENCRKKLASLMAKEPDKEWASQAIEAFEQGKSSIRALEMACEVLGVTPDYWIKPQNRAR